MKRQHVVLNCDPYANRSPGGFGYSQRCRLVVSLQYLVGSSYLHTRPLCADLRAIDGNAQLPELHVDEHRHWPLDGCERTVALQYPRALQTLIHDLNIVHHSRWTASAGSNSQEHERQPYSCDSRIQFCGHPQSMRPTARFRHHSRMIIVMVSVLGAEALRDRLPAVAWRLRWVLALGLACIGVTVVLARQVPHSVTTSGASPTQFSLQRAWPLLESLARQPHPVGGHEQFQMRAFIIEQLRLLAIAVSEQSADAALNMAGSNQSAHVHNILAMIPGREPTAKAVLLVAHYDTVPNGRGAGDNGAAVAALLETARALKQGPLLRRNVYLLFDDAEELGLLGARAFIASHPAAQQVGIVINFEARGVAGPVMMYQSSANSGPLVAGYGRSSPYPHTNSLISQLSHALPNDSDASLFIQAGYPVLAFAFVEGLEHYHRYSDSAENLDARSLAHCGIQALAMARYFAELGELPQPKYDSVYFDVMGRFVVHYPGLIANLLGTLCALGWLLLVRRELAAKRCTMRGIARGAKLQVIVLGLALVVPTMLHLLRSLMIDEGWLVRHAATYGLSDLLVVAALNLLFYTGANRQSSPRGLLLGGLSLSVLLALVLGWLVPQASAPWQWISACTLLVWRFEPLAVSQRPSLSIAWHHLPLAFAVALLGPVVNTALGAAGPALMAIPLLLAMSVTGLFLPTMLPRASKHLAQGAFATAAVGFALMLVVTLLPREVRSQPAETSLIYAVDAETRTAVYASTDIQSNAWTEQWIPPGSARQPLLEFTPALGIWRQAQAQPHLPAVPQVSVVDLQSDGQHRLVELRLASSSETRCVKLWQPQGEPVRVISVNQQPVMQFVRFSPRIDELGMQVLGGVREQRVWALNYCGLVEEPLVLRLQLSKGQSARLRLVTESMSLPEPGLHPKKSRPPNIVPGRQSDVTWVGRDVVL